VGALYSGEGPGSKTFATQGLNESNKDSTPGVVAKGLTRPRAPRKEDRRLLAKGPADRFTAPRRKGPARDAAAIRLGEETSAGSQHPRKNR